eukprot:CAMPEP_0171021604 /NCGR_PEP_ID=MMETSP0736-20130129/30766_1 /TAXON_ID=186038 /ORGANISM="Fragilariopsis kerguelensis, Strain L26-C5" /LENGTH=35 /DNA_ID= /DNA_START= /DNA_END= /DNA_ORIENTATION=
MTSFFMPVFAAEEDKIPADDDKKEEDRMDFNPCNW